jgi:hypothetical protein
VALALGIVALTVVAGGAQETFRVTWNVDRSSPARTRITGQVFNDGRFDAVDVSVTAEAIDAGGKVVARGISFVASSIPPRSSAAFEAAVPAPSSATTFRVRVSSFRFGYGMQQSP